MVDLFLSNARLQYNHFLQHQKISLLLLPLQYNKDMLIAIASCDQQQ